MWNKLGGARLTTRLRFVEKKKGFLPHSHAFCIQTHTCMHFTMHFPLILSYYVYLSSINAFEKPLLPFVKLTLSSKDMHNFT